MTYEYNAYIDDVLNKKLTVCKNISLAVRRHVNDLKASKKTFPYYFDDKRARMAIDFFREQVHIESCPTPQFKSIHFLLLSHLYSPTLTTVHDY